MKRSPSPNPKPVRMQALGALVLAACRTGISGFAAADYQQTLAAKGADAFTPPSSLNSIEQGDIQKVFLMDAESGNRAISDQDIMIDLHARMRAENQLDKAAENLEPSAFGKEPSAVGKEPSAPTTTTSAASSETEESSTTIAAR
jgi:hypothetical protein